MKIHTLLAAWLSQSAKSDGISLHLSSPVAGEAVVSDLTLPRALAQETLAPLSSVTALSADEVRERCYQARMEVERSHLI